MADSKNANCIILETSVDPMIDKTNEKILKIHHFERKPSCLPGSGKREFCNTINKILENNEQIKSIWLEAQSISNQQNDAGNVKGMTDDDVRQKLAEVNPTYKQESKSLDLLRQVLQTRLNTDNLAKYYSKTYGFTIVEFDKDFQFYKMTISRDEWLKRQHECIFEEGQNKQGGRTREKFISTTMKVITEKGPRKVYVNHRGVNYVRLNKTFVLLSRIKTHS